MPKDINPYVIEDPDGYPRDVRVAYPEDTNLYKEIERVKDGTKVISYELEYKSSYGDLRNEDEDSPVELYEFSFCGNGEIDWEKIIDVTNKAITIYEDGIFFVDYDYFLKDWRGRIWLDDGGYIELAEVYDNYNDDYVFRAVRHKPLPKPIKAKKGFVSNYKKIKVN